MLDDLADLSRRHKTYGATSHYLPLIERVLIETVREALPDETVPETIEAWEQLFGHAATLMARNLLK